MNVKALDITSAFFFLSSVIASSNLGKSLTSLDKNTNANTLGHTESWFKSTFVQDYAYEDFKPVLEVMDIDYELIDNAMQRNKCSQNTNACCFTPFYESYAYISNRVLHKVRKASTRTFSSSNKNRIYHMKGLVSPSRDLLDAYTDLASYNNLRSHRD